MIVGQFFLAFFIALCYIKYNKIFPAMFVALGNILNHYKIIGNLTLAGSWAG